MQLIEFFDRGAALAADRVAFAGPGGADAITYRAAERLSHRVAAALHREGLRAPAAVGVLSSNAPALFPWILGVTRAGCTWVALNARSTPDELAAMLALVGARALLHAPSMAATAAEVVTAVPDLDRLVTIGDEDWLGPDTAHVELPALDPEAIAGLFGTGGTTGRPKAVRVSHRAFETMIHAFNAHMPERAPVNLVAAPMTHAAGAALFPVLSLGGTTIVHDGVNPSALLESLEHDGVTRLFLPPTAIYTLLDHPTARGRDYTRLRYFLYGAAPMSVERLAEAWDVFGPVMAQCYGQTELPMMCAFLSPEDHALAMSSAQHRGRLASAGRPSLVANVRIAAETGTLLPPGAPGEIVVRSSLRMSGYHEDRQQTAAALRPGGWQATGDVGYLDEDGYLYIIDRSRDLIISGGFNVFPSEVEQVLFTHPLVSDCAVIGIPDPRWGEQVTAVVELRPGAAPDAAELERELIALCKERLGSVKAPKQVVLRVLPRSPVGKVLKRQLRDEFWQGRERLV
jgi:acyl-CoA synthetase (AMP-forming)/AMP-acid ligase II